MDSIIQQRATLGQIRYKGEAVPSGCGMCSAKKTCLSRLFMDADVRCFEDLLVGQRRVARHVSLFQTHDYLSKLYAVRFGQFKLMKPDGMGGYSVSQFYMTGDLMGLDAIATGSHAFTLTALEDSEVCEISYASMMKIMAAEPLVLRRFLQSMSGALNDQADHLSALSRPNLDERFATFLLQLGARYKRLGYSSTSFRLGMTRGDIGSYLGTTMESVSRLIARFNADQSVSISGRLVEIHDRAYLIGLLARHDERPDLRLL